MINTTYFWPFGAILGPFGLFWIFSDKLDFLPQKQKSASWPKWFGAKIKFCLKGSKRFQMGQKWPNMAELLMSQIGLWGSKWSKMINLTFLTIWGHFGSIWTLMDHIRRNLIFAPNHFGQEALFCFWGKKSSIVWKDQKEFICEWFERFPICCSIPWY